MVLVAVVVVAVVCGLSNGGGGCEGMPESKTRVLALCDAASRRPGQLRPGLPRELRAFGVALESGVRAALCALELVRVYCDV